MFAFDAAVDFPGLLIFYRKQECDEERVGRKYGEQWRRYRHQI